MIRQEAYRKLDDVRDEYHASRFTLARTLKGFETEPRMLELGREEKVTIHHLQSCAANLQITYLLRLFAEFEGILRDYWANGRRRTTSPRMAQLLDNIAAYRFINSTDLQHAHEIREYRNEVIHNHLQDPRFDFRICRSRLASFVHWLPLRW